MKKVPEISTSIGLMIWEFSEERTNRIQTIQLRKSGRSWMV